MMVFVVNGSKSTVVRAESAESTPVGFKSKAHQSCPFEGPSKEESTDRFRATLNRD